jgi:hypothetical protein
MPCPPPRPPLLQGGESKRWLRAKAQQKGVSTAAHNATVKAMFSSPQSEGKETAFPTRTPRSTS